MKNIRTHVMLYSMFACVSLCYAMEEGYVAGGEPMELEHAKGKGKRSAQGQPEGEASLKKEKTERVSVRGSLIKELIENRYVINPNTGDYDIKPEVVKKIIINNVRESEFFTHKTFKQLIQDRTKEGLYYIMATITTQGVEAEEIKCYDAYSLLQHVFTTDYVQDQFGIQGSRDTRPYWRRYNTAQNNPMFKTTIINQPIFGPIKFYMIKNINDPAFIFVGSDYDLHANPDGKIRAHLRRLLEANKPNELVILETDDEEEKANKVSERSANQIMLGIEYYKEKKYDEALHYYTLAQKDENGDYTANEYENNDYFEAPRDSTLLIALLYYTQKKYDEAFKEIENFFGNSESERYGGYLILSKSIHERLGGQKFDICELLGDEFYKEKKYRQAQYCLKHVFNKTPETASLLKTIEEHLTEE